MIWVDNAVNHAEDYSRDEYKLILSYSRIFTNNFGTLVLNFFSLNYFLPETRNEFFCFF